MGKDWKNDLGNLVGHFAARSVSVNAGSDVMARIPVRSDEASEVTFFPGLG